MEKAPSEKARRPPGGECVAAAWHRLLAAGRCPRDKQDAFLDLVRGFEAREVPADCRPWPAPLGSREGAGAGAERPGVVLCALARGPPCLASYKS
jgi:hypothetical protein